MTKSVWCRAYAVGRRLQIAGSPGAIRRAAIIEEKAEDHVVHPVTIPVEAVAGGVNNTLVEAYNGSTRAGHVLTRCVGNKDFSNGREGIRRFPIARGLPHLLGCFPLAGVDASLCEIGSIAGLLIGVGGIAHAHRCPMADDDLWNRIHRVLNNRLRRS